MYMYVLLMYVTLRELKNIEGYCTIAEDLSE